MVLLGEWLSPSIYVTVRRIAKKNRGFVVGQMLPVTRLRSRQCHQLNTRLAVLVVIWATAIGSSRFIWAKVFRM